MPKKSKQVSSKRPKVPQWGAVDLTAAWVPQEVRTGIKYNRTTTYLKELMARPLHAPDKFGTAVHPDDKELIKDLKLFVTSPLSFHFDDFNRWMACVFINILEGESACVEVRMNECCSDLKEYVDQTIMSWDRTE